MSAPLDTRRRRVVLALAASAGGLALVTISSAGMGGTAAPAPERLGGAVLPGFADWREALAAIRVTLADDRYTLVREGEAWGLAEAGGYPVREDRLQALAAGLEGLTWQAARTTDPRKLDRIALGDPAEGGRGARVDLFDRAGAPLGAFITGRRGERLYARHPDETAAFLVAGDLPPLMTRDAWLDFQVISLRPETVRAVRITDRTGESLFLMREAGEGRTAFRPGPPNEDDRLVNPLAAATPALALARFAPVDVKPAADLATEPVARHVTLTFDGLEVTTEAYEEPDGRYVTVYAVEAGEGARRAEAINARAEGWAFRLPAIDWSEFAPPVSSIVERALVEPPER